MRLAWLRALNTCLQFIVRDADDVEVEAGEVKVGELRPRAFPQLRTALTDDQTLAFGWLALADVATWPQLEASEAHALANSIERVAPVLPFRAVTASSPRDAGYLAAAAALAFVAQAQNRLESPLAAPPVDFEPIRGAVNALAHFRTNRVLFWEQWLRRVIESAAAATPEEACACAVAALRGTLNLPPRFEYQATAPNGQVAHDATGPVRLSAVTPRSGGRVVLELGQMTDLQPVERKLNARLTPNVPIDRYRMGYVLRSVCLAELLQDAKRGYYDTVAVTNVSTGEVWGYASA